MELDPVEIRLVVYLISQVFIYLNSLIVSLSFIEEANFTITYDQRHFLSTSIHTVLKKKSKVKYFIYTFIQIFTITISMIIGK